MKIKVLLLLTIVFVLAIIITNNVLSPYWAHDDRILGLARSFLNGKLYFIDNYSDWTDTTLFRGHYYWPYGPVTSLIILPFVSVFNIFDLCLSPGYVNFCLVIVNAYLVYLISRKFAFNNRSAIIWTLAFVVSSPFIQLALIPNSWIYQTLAMVFQLLILYEVLYKKRWWLIGIYCGLLLDTRLTAGITFALFVCLYLFFIEIDLRDRWRGILLFAYPIIISLFFLALYNYARFGDPLETGYLGQIGIVNTEPSLDKTKYGMISLNHIPGQLYHFFVAGPLPVFQEGNTHVFKYPYIKNDPWGISLFWTSPYLLLLLFYHYKDRLSKIIFLCLAVSLVMVLTWFTTGKFQFGCRYALDFFPLVFFLLIGKYHKKQKFISDRLAITIISFSLFNLYLILTY